MITFVIASLDFSPNVLYTKRCLTIPFCHLSVINLKQQQSNNNNNTHTDGFTCAHDIIMQTFLSFTG